MDNMKDKNKSVLVTGASGQLGRKLVPRLIEQGFGVRAHFRSRKKADQWCPKNAEPAYGDLLEPSWLRDACKNIDYVIHCAAKVSLRRTDDPDFAKINIDGTRSIINACQFNGVKRLIHISSIIAVGGSVDHKPLDETFDFNLAGFGIPYFETKYKSENIALNANSDNLETVVLNPAIMISAPDRDLTRGDLEKIPKRIPVYFDFGFNFVNTDDVIDGIIKALEFGRSGNRYILGGENVSAKRAIELAQKYLGIKKPYFRIPYPVLYSIGLLSELISSSFALFNKIFPGSKFNLSYARLSKMRFYYSSEKAIKELGYNPRPLDQSINEILNGLSQQVIKRETQVKKAAV